MVHGAANDHVNVVALHQLAEIFENRRVGPLFLRFGEVRFIHVAERDDAAIARGVPRVALAHAAATNERYRGLFVWTEGVGARGSRFTLFEKPFRQRGRRRNRRGGFEEAASSTELGWIMALVHIALDSTKVKGIDERISFSELTQDKCYRGGELDEASDDTLTQVRGYPSNEHESVCQAGISHPNSRPLWPRRSAIQKPHSR